MFWIPIIISILALIISIIVNACLVSFLLGKMTANQESIEKMLNEYKETTKENIKEYKSTTESHFNRLELKQDKHNNLIERMAVVERDTKSAHHREDEIVKRLDKLEECRK